MTNKILLTLLILLNMNVYAKEPKIVLEQCESMFTDCEVVCSEEDESKKEKCFQKCDEKHEKCLEKVQTE